MLLAAVRWQRIDSALIITSRKAAVPHGAAFLRTSGLLLRISSWTVGEQATASSTGTIMSVDAFRSHLIP